MSTKMLNSPIKMKEEIDEEQVKRPLVKKRELQNLVKGKKYDEIEELPFDEIGQGYGYKNCDAHMAGDDYVCYIPEFCYNETTEELDPECCYSKADFIKLANGDEGKADMIFDAIDWQHPTSLWLEWKEEFDKDEGDNRRMNGFNKKLFKLLLSKLWKWVKKR